MSGKADKSNQQDRWLRIRTVSHKATRSLRGFMAGMHWPRLTWTAIGTIAALGMSAASLYFQFWPQHRATATVVGLSVGHAGDLSGRKLWVTVDIALWNRGNTPAVVSAGYLLFDVCPDLESPLLLMPARRFDPLIIPPHDMALRSLGTEVNPADVDDRIVEKCAHGLKTAKNAFFVGVALEAMQANGELKVSQGLGGLVVAPKEPGNVNFPVAWPVRPPSVRPFSVVPATHGVDYYQYWFAEEQETTAEVRRLESEQPATSNKRNGAMSPH